MLVCIEKIVLWCKDAAEKFSKLLTFFLFWYRVILVSDHSGEEIPVPIPNTEVKLSSVDDTARWWESRKLLTFFILNELSKSDFMQCFSFGFSKRKDRIL